MYPESISNDDTMIDVRTLIDRQAHLVRELEIAEDPEDPAPDYMSDDERAELDALTSLVRNVLRLYDSGTLIRESEFVRYVRQQWEETSSENSNAWPFSYIDWDAAADEERPGYDEYDFDGVTYLIQ